MLDVSDAVLPAAPAAMAVVVCIGAMLPARMNNRDPALSRKPTIEKTIEDPTAIVMVTATKKIQRWTGGGWDVAREVPTQ
jgi:hypothetical protein